MEERFEGWVWEEGGEGSRPPAPYLGRDLLAAGLMFKPSLRVVEGRLGLGICACRRWVVVVVMVGVLGAQVELCKARGHTAGLAEGLRAGNHGWRRRRGGSAVVAL